MFFGNSIIASMAARQTNEPVQSLLFLGYGFTNPSIEMFILYKSTSTKTGLVATMQLLQL
jgi:hypothetical protein